MKSLKNRLFAALALLSLAVFAAGWFLFRQALREQLVTEAIRELQGQSLVMAQLLQSQGPEGFTLVFPQMDQELASRLTLIDGQGEVVLDSSGESWDNHIDRPEVRQALVQGFGHSLRYSRSAHSYYLYCARRVDLEGTSLVLRLSYPMTTLSQAMAASLQRALGLLALTLALTLLLQLWILKRFFAPLRELAAAADAVTQQPKTRFPLMEDPELQRLSEALSSMSDRLRSAAATIEAERQDLATIVAALPVGLIAVEEGRIQRANASALRLLGLEESVLGQKAQAALPPEGAELLEELDQGPRSCLMNLPERGLYLKLEALAMFRGALVLVMDLSESRRLELARRNFIADAGHEFQTPLTAIAMTAEYLLGDETNLQRRKDLERILQQQQRLTGLVDDLLYLSKLEAQPDHAPKERQDLSEILSAVMADMEAHPLRGAIELHSSLPTGAWVEASGDGLAKAATNLVDNAIKYTRQRWGEAPGGKVTVAVTKDPAGNHWLLTVEDNGIGIDSDQGDTLFQRFQRGDPSRSRQGWGQGGYGLGLAIARHAVENHGGAIALLPRQKGTAVQIRLPALD